MNATHNVFITKDWVVLSENNLKVYNEIRANFIKDYGKDVSFEEADYNPDVKVLGCCRIDSKILDEGEKDEECEAIIASLATIVYNKNKRLTKERSIDDYKALKIEELKTSRDNEELSPIDYNNCLWDFDDKAQQRINGAIIALADGGSITWTSADNESIENVTAEILRGVVGAAAIRSNSLHIKYRQLKEQVEACQTVDEVETIEW